MDKVLGVVMTILVFIGIPVLMSLGLTLSIYHMTEPDWRAEAIDRGYALHCPATGEWAWRGECGEDGQ